MLQISGQVLVLEREHSFSKENSLCVCNQLPVLAVCPNHEVVVFQPRTGNTPVLGSVASYKFYSGPPAPPVSTIFLDLFSSLFRLNPPSPPPTSNRSSSYHLSLLHPLPTYSPAAKYRPPGRLPHPPPSSLRRSTLRPAQRVCVCRYFPHPFVSPLLPPACA